MADEHGQRWEQGTPTPPIVAHASPEVPPYGDEIERLRAELALADRVSTRARMFIMRLDGETERPLLDALAAYDAARNP